MSEELCVLRQIDIAPTTGESEGFCASVVVQLIDGLGAATREGTAQVELNRLLA